MILNLIKNVFEKNTVFLEADIAHFAVRMYVVIDLLRKLIKLFVCYSAPNFILLHLSLGAKRSIFIDVQRQDHNVTWTVYSP